MPAGRPTRSRDDGGRRSRDRYPRDHARCDAENLYAGYAFQHEQIAAYSSLKVLANAAGHGGSASWVDQTIEEKRTAAKEVVSFIEPVTRTFIERNGK